MKNKLILGLLLVAAGGMLSAKPQEDYIDTMKISKNKSGEPVYTNYYNNSTTAKQATLRNMDAEAFVVPDFIGESTLYLPDGNNKKYVPGDNLSLIVLSDKGKTVYTLVWDNPQTVVSTKTKFITAELLPGSSLRVYEMQGDNLWYQAKEKLNNQDWLPINWRIPFVADFQAMFRKTVGVLPPENGTTENWKMVPDNKKGQEVATSLAIYNGDNWSNWISGYGGTIYPTKTGKNYSLLRYLLANEYPHQAFDGSFGVYIYPWSNEKHPEYWEGMNIPAKPANVLMPLEAVKGFLPAPLWQSISETVNAGAHYPATCSSTEFVEKIYYRSEAAEKIQEIAQRIAEMNNFVRTIRARIENFRTWAKQNKAYLAANAPADIAKIFNADFDYLEQYYQQALPRMQTPEQSEVLSSEMVTTATRTDIDDEAKEERAKELGRAIRVIGGTQDTTVAEFRRIAKCVRQKATSMYAEEKDPKRRAVLQAIRLSAAEALHNRMPHEGK